MPLTKSQKKLARRLLHRLTVPEIAVRLSASETELSSYLKKFNKPKNDNSLRINTLSATVPLKKLLGPVLLIIILTFAVYANSLPNEFVSDDLAGFRDNPKISSLSFISENPLIGFKALLYFLVNRLFGMHPWAFRIIHIFFHALSAVIVFLTAGLFFHPAGALLAGLLVAVHPVFSETVVWVAGGGYALYGSLFLVSFYLYLIGSKSKRKKSLSVFTFLLMVLSSDKGIFLALLFPLYEILSGSFRKNWRQTLPYLTVSGIWIFLMFSVFGGVAVRQETLAEKFRVSGFYNPLVQLPVAISSYLNLTIFPLTLSFFHSETEFTLLEYGFRLVIFLIFVTGMAVSFFRSKKIFFFLAGAIISLLPTLTPLTIGWVVAERYAYLAYIFFILTAVTVFESLTGKFPLKRIHYLVPALLLLILATRTIIRNTDWQNEDILWQATYKTAPNDPRVHNNIGEIHLRRGEFDRAETEFKQALSLNPDRPIPYYNLGSLYYKTNQPENAVVILQEGISRIPKYPEFYRLLSTVYYDRGSYRETLETLKKLEGLVPVDAVTYYNLGKTYLKLGDRANARTAFEKTLTLDPDFASAKKLLEGL